MTIATEKILSETNALFEKRKAEIKSSSGKPQIIGTVYYVSNSGNDGNDGLTPDTAWKTTDKISSAELKAGDGVLLKRGDTFRGKIKAHSGVSYGAYGDGEKPRVYGWDEDLASPELWEEYDNEKRIWRYKKKILDAGTLVFNEGEAHSIKLIPSYIGGRFVCRDDESRLFDMRNEMKRDLDIYWHYEDTFSTKPSKGQDFPIPEVNDKTFGNLYLRCDRGNPGDVFNSIEAVVKRVLFSVGKAENVKIDNICMKYTGHHAVAAGGECSVGLKVTNCEIGWVGGSIQHYTGTDPNYPEGGRGTVTRFGNGVEVYGGCYNYEVSNCYIYEIYDAGITHQVTTQGKKFVMKNVLYKDNLIENCVYSIEYFLEMNKGDTESYMENIEICRNFLRNSGYGWGQQRHNKHTPAHIKGWSYTNKAHDFRIHGNIFDRAAYRMLHLVAEDEESCPLMFENTYIQHDGGKIGQYGGNKIEEPENLSFDQSSDKKIEKILKDKGAKVYIIK